MTHTRKAQIDSLLPTAPSVKVDTCGIRTADPCPLARTLPPLGRWSGSFSHGVSFLGRETKDQPFNSYRCHPQGVFTGPYLLRRPYHPQKPASQTLRLQGAPPTPAPRPSRIHCRYFGTCGRTRRIRYRGESDKGRKERSLIKWLTKDR